MRKVHVKVEVDLYIVAGEEISIDDVIQEMDYNFTSMTTGAIIEDTQIENYEVKDSR